jgi:hypothetical protein
MAVKVLGDVLRAAAGVQAIAGDRVYPLHRPQDIQVPAVTLQRVSVGPQNALHGFAGLDSNRVQATCYAVSYAEARSLAAACRAAADAAGHICRSEADGYESEVEVYLVTQEYSVWV